MPIPPECLSVFVFHCWRYIDLSGSYGLHLGVWASPFRHSSYAFLLQFGSVHGTLTSVLCVRGSERPVVFRFVVHKASHLLVRPVLGRSR